jgi:Cytochrome P450
MRVQILLSVEDEDQAKRRARDFDIKRLEPSFLDDPYPVYRALREPELLDIQRHPNRHLAFGTGIHACAGMSLARMEGQVAIGKLVKRFETLEHAGKFVRGGRARFRGFLRYPLRLA